jgi:uncharacterized protein (TIGR03086 family)
MDQVVAHQRAQDAFAGVLANVSPEQLAGPTPCSRWDSKALIDHVIGGNQWVQERAGLAPPALPEDLVAAHAMSAAGAHAVFAAPDGLSRSFELPFGTLPGSAFIVLRTTDVLTHAWDLARATGQPTDLDPEVAEEMLERGQRLMNPAFRGEGRAFGEEQPCSADAAAADRLAAFLGRPVA